MFSIEKDNKNIKIFVEKTPHNLLNLENLTEFSSNIKYIHVNRDPSAICNSLLNMEWGPNDEAGCIKWLKNYYTRFLQIKKFAEDQNIGLFNLNIEDIEHNSNILKELTEFLELSNPINLSIKITEDRLNSWRSTTDTKIITRFDEELNEFRTYFGYHP